MVYMLPECMDRAVLDFLGQYAALGGNLILNSACSYFNDGKPAGEGFAALLREVPHHFPLDVSTRDAMRILRSWNVAGNMPPGGCVYQDGSVIFTAPGVLDCGNPLEVDCMIGGHRVQFEGDDFLCLALDTDGRVVRQALGTKVYLSVDGKPGT